MLVAQVQLSWRLVLVCFLLVHSPRCVTSSHRVRVAVSLRELQWSASVHRVRPPRFVCTLPLLLVLLTLRGGGPLLSMTSLLACLLSLFRAASARHAVSLVRVRIVVLCTIGLHSVLLFLTRADQ